MSKSSQSSLAVKAASKYYELSKSILETRKTEGEQARRVERDALKQRKEAKTYLQKIKEYETKKDRRRQKGMSEQKTRKKSTRDSRVHAESRDEDDHDEGHQHPEKQNKTVKAKQHLRQAKVKNLRGKNSRNKSARDRQEEAESRDDDRVEVHGYEETETKTTKRKQRRTRERERRIPEKELGIEDHSIRDVESPQNVLQGIWALQGPNTKKTLNESRHSKNTKTRRNEPQSVMDDIWDIQVERVSKKKGSKKANVPVAEPSDKSASSRTYKSSNKSADDRWEV
jgi:hypothetical protein